jgi:hypothetical protein
MRTGEHRGRSPGRGCGGSARRFSRSSCTSPGALILDNRLANAVYSLSGLPHLVSGKGRSLAWTPYRYAVYLHWMRQTADAVGAEPEMLELALFQQPEDLDDEHDAAD